ncbi:MAG: 4-hydroxybenzoate decarboxylase, partial [Desulfurivibrionaceae bacterium]
MSQNIIRDLRAFLEILRREDSLLEVSTPVDPDLEIAEIHRRVIAQGGPALLFTNVKGSSFPVVTNLFGTARRLELAFGKRPQQFVTDLVRAAETLMPPSLGKIWEMRSLLGQATKVGLKKVPAAKAPILEVCQTPARLSELPLLTSWATDGGAFVTLPLV